MYSEPRAKRILQLERESKLIAWDKANPAPKKPTLRQKVEAALSDPCWIKAAGPIAGRDLCYYDWCDVDRSGKVALLLAPLAEYKKRRDDFVAKLEDDDRARLIAMLREK